MLDLIRMKHIQPSAAEGRIRLELKDPLTGKVREQIKGKNYIFEDALFTGVGFDWSAAVSASWLCLNDDQSAVDPECPFLLGQTIGYGKPSTAGVGPYLGGYVSTAQVLAGSTLEKLYWNFQYEFTASQAIGTIGSMGLTNQYYNYAAKHISCFKPPAFFTNITKICDGRRVYTCSTAGIVTRYDTWLGTSDTVDVSASVGTTAASIKSVGFDPGTGKYYIMVYSATTSLRKVYRFSDNTFTTLETTYSPTNNTAGGTASPLYVYNGLGYFFNTTSVSVIDFINNLAPTTINITAINNAAYYNSSTATVGTANNSQTVAWSHYVCCWNNSTTKQGMIFDLAAGAWAGNCITPASTNSIALHPRAAHALPAVFVSPIVTNCAITKYTLPTPVTKNGSDALTVTYELDVFY